MKKRVSPEALFFCLQISVAILRCSSTATSEYKKYTIARGIRCVLSFSLLANKKLQISVAIPRGVADSFSLRIPHSAFRICEGFTPHSALFSKAKLLEAEAEVA